MLSKYLKQCCLVIIPEGETENAGFTAIHKVISELELDKRVYSASCTTASEWKNFGYYTELKSELTIRDLRKYAFNDAFNNGYRKVILLSQVPQGINSKIIEEAFLSLRILETCMGPCKSGQLYLSGFNNYRPEILESSLLEDSFTWKSFQKAAGAVKAAMYKTPLL